MKKGIMITAFLLGMVYGPAATAVAAEEVVQRLCTAEDLTGTFVLGDLQETPKGDEAVWFQEYPFHYLIFYPGNAYAYVALRHTPAKPEDLQKSIKMASDAGDHELERKYSLDSNSILNLYLEGKLDYSYRCMVAIKAFNKVRAGDIVLTGYSKKRTQLYKVFRHPQSAPQPQGQ